MTRRPLDYIVNPGPKTPVCGLEAAVAIVPGTIIAVQREDGNAAYVLISGDETNGNMAALTDPRRGAVVDSIAA